MPKLVIAGLALLAVLAVAAMVQATSLVPPPPPNNGDELDRIEKLRQSEAALWGRLDQAKSNWWQLVYERAKRTSPQPPLQPIIPIRPPPVQPLPVQPLPKAPAVGAPS